MSWGLMVLDVRVEDLVCRTLKQRSLPHIGVLGQWEKTLRAGHCVEPFQERDSTS